MTTTAILDHDARRIAAIAAAIQAYLDGEERRTPGISGGISAWRRLALSENHNPLTGRQRSWTGRT